MRRITRWRGAPWLAMGLAIGALLAPAAAISAAGLVKIVGLSGKQANVNAANQLFTAPTSPSQFRSRYHFGVGNTCVEVYAVPAGKGFILTSATFNTWTNPTPGAANFVDLSRASNCDTGQIVARVNPPGFGLSVAEFNPGFALPAGSKLYSKTTGGVIADARIAGYLVPSAAVPSATPGTGRIVPSARVTQD
jgi:hypothetical protein